MASEWRTGRSSDTGQVLLLVPAAVLIVIVLGAIAVDSSVAFLARRELVAAADAAANDAATYGLRQTNLRRGEGYELDHDRMATVARESIRDRSMAVQITDVVVRQRADREVDVALQGEAPLIFAKALPGAADSVTVKASARVAAVQSEVRVERALQTGRAIADL